MKYRREAAVVEKVEGGGYILRLPSPSEEQCARCGLCETGEEDAGARFLRIAASDMKGRPSAGESVEVHIPDFGKALAALVILGVPLGGGMAGFITAALLYFTDWAAIALGGAGFALGLTVSYLMWGRRAKPYAKAGS